MDLGRKTTRSLWNAQEENYFRTSAKTTTTGPTVWSGSRCLRICNRSSTNAKRQNRQKTSRGLFLKHPKWRRMKLRHLHPGTICNSASTQELETIPSRIPSRGHCPHQSCKSPILERTPQDQQKDSTRSCQAIRIQCQAEKHTRMGKQKSQHAVQKTRLWPRKWRQPEHCCTSWGHVYQVRDALIHTQRTTATRWRSNTTVGGNPRSQESKRRMVEKGCAR